MAAYDDYGNWQDDPEPSAPGGNQNWTPGNGSVLWNNSYDPGPNWNGGVAPGAPSPRYDYNNDSPPDQALTAGHGWEWQGPQAPQWDMSVNQWQRGAWQEVAGRGKGYVAVGPTAPPPPRTDGGQPPPTTNGGGAGSVPSMPASGISVPGSQLPGDISSLFNQTPQKTAVQSAYQDALLKYMAKAQTTPSLDDPTLAPQVEVFRAGAQRGQERQRLAASERAAANGQSQSGYLDNLIMKGVQDQGFNTASYNANLLGGEMSKRREELNSALQLARATGDAEAARELQTRLAQASAAMQQQALNLQGQLGGGDLALRLLQTNQGQQNFYDQLGVNTALNLENLNQSALQRVLSGLS